jgi:hypothetical protein
MANFPKTYMGKVFKKAFLLDFDQNFNFHNFDEIFCVEPF